MVYSVFHIKISFFFTKSDVKFELKLPPKALGRLEKVNELVRKAVSHENAWLTVCIDHALDRGIYQCDMRFDRSDYSGDSVGYCGVSRADYAIPYPC